MKAADEQQRLIDLLRTEELEQADAAEARQRREHREQVQLQMAEANRVQLQLKVPSFRQCARWHVLLMCWADPCSQGYIALWTCAAGGEPAGIWVLACRLSGRWPSRPKRRASDSSCWLALRRKTGWSR